MLYVCSLLRYFLRLASALGRSGHIVRFVSTQVLLLIVLWENVL